MDDISLTVRRNKRGNDTKLCLSSRLISMIPSQGTIKQQKVYQLSHLEILDLSNNKISTIDNQILNLKQLKMLDLSNNCICQLESFITKMNFQIFNLSNNPLNQDFQTLLKTENQQNPNLKRILQECFQINKELVIQKKENIWFDNPMNKSDYSQKNDQIENLLKQEQQKVIELQSQLQQLQKTNANIVYIQEQKNEIEIDINEITTSKIISQGGFSIVYTGIYKGTEVAVKKIFDPNVTQDLIDELYNELNMLQKLRHPNIVLIMGVVTKPPNLCIITEYLQNGSLFNLLHQTKKEINFQKKVQISLQIAKALNFLHLSKIVHRDVKSHNIILDEYNNIKLCDFGLAKNYVFKYLQKDEINKGSKQFCGTPSYMAPELFQKKAYNNKIDIFAFGTLLWEIFKREVPYEGQDPQDIMKKVIQSVKLETIEIEIQQIVVKCREYNPDQRPDFQYIINQLQQI